MQAKKFPMRICTGCGLQKQKRELVRVVKSKDGEVSLDLTGKKPGRGAYVCRDPECLKKARKNRRIERSFQMKIPDEIYDIMEEELGADK